MTPVLITLEPTAATAALEVQVEEWMLHAIEGLADPYLGGPHPEDPVSSAVYWTAYNSPPHSALSPSQRTCVVHDPEENRHLLRLGLWPDESLPGGPPVQCGGHSIAFAEMGVGDYAISFSMATPSSASVDVIEFIVAEGTGPCDIEARSCAGGETAPVSCQYTGSDLICQMQVTVDPGRTWQNFYGCFAVTAGSLIGLGVQSVGGASGPPVVVDDFVIVGSAPFTAAPISNSPEGRLNGFGDADSLRASQAVDLCGGSQSCVAALRPELRVGGVPGFRSPSWRVALSPGGQPARYLDLQTISPDLLIVEEQPSTGLLGAAAGQQWSELSVHTSPLLGGGQFLRGFAFFAGMQAPGIEVTHSVDRRLDPGEAQATIGLLAGLSSCAAGPVELAAAAAGRPWLDPADGSVGIHLEIDAAASGSTSPALAADLAGLSWTAGPDASARTLPGGEIVVVDGRLGLCEWSALVAKAERDGWSWSSRPQTADEVEGAVVTMQLLASMAATDACDGGLRCAATLSRLNPAVAAERPLVLVAVGLDMGVGGPTAPDPAPLFTWAQPGWEPVRSYSPQPGATVVEGWVTADALAALLAGQAPTAAALRIRLAKPAEPALIGTLPAP